MKQISVFFIHILVIPFIVLSIILSGCSDSDENEGERLREIIRKDSNIQRVTYGHNFFDDESEDRVCDEEQKNSVIDYILSICFDEVSEDEAENVYGGGTWVHIYLSDGTKIFLMFYGSNFYFQESETGGGILYSDPTGNADLLFEYISNLKK